MDVTFWALALAIILVLLYVVGTYPYGYFTKHKLPFSRPLPFLGNMGPLLLRKEAMVDYLKRIYDTHKGNSLVGFYEFLKPIVMVCDPEMIKQITVKDAEYFLDHRSAITEDLDPLIGKNLVALQGQRWKNMRSTLSPAFTSSKMKAMFLLVDKCGEQMVDHLEKRCNDEPNGILSLDMKQFFTKYTNDVIATSAFGIHCDSMEHPDNEFYQMGQLASNVNGSRLLVFLGFMVIPKFMKLLKVNLLPTKLNNFFRSLVHETIAVREKEGIIRPDMIHLLMQAQKGTLQHDVTDEEHTQEKTKMTELSDDDITAQALLFFLAGFDTTSTLLCFVSHLLAVNKEVQESVQEEIDAVLAEDDGKFTYDGILRMKYLDMVVSETLRLFPPGPLTDRRCIKPYVLPATKTSPELNVKPGDGFWIPIHAIQRDPQYYENPEKFDPERFSEENKQKIHPFTYLPFGVGPRNCIGMRFALMEAKVAIACILARFHFEVVEKTILPLKIDPKAFNFAPVGGFWVGIKSRA